MTPFRLLLESGGALQSIICSAGKRFMSEIPASAMGNERFGSRVPLDALVQNSFCLHFHLHTPVSWPRGGLEVLEHKATLSSGNEFYQAVILDIFLHAVRRQVKEKAEHLLESAIRVVL